MRALGVFALVGWASVAAAQSQANPYLNQAQIFYQGLEFEKCVQRLEQAARWDNTPAELVAIEIYAGLCRYSLGLPKDAEDHFLLALQLDRTAELPPFTSPKIQAVFDRVRAQLPPPPRSGPAADAPRKVELAPDAKEPSGADAALVTDVGPRRRLGIPLAFGAAAVASAGVGVALGLQARTLETQANAAHFESDAVRLGQSAQQRALFANVGFGVAAAAASGAVVSWLLSDSGE